MNQKKSVLTVLFGGHGWEDWFPIIEKAMNYAVE